MIEYYLNKKTMPQCTDTLGSYDLDLKIKKKLFQEAGWLGGNEVKIMHWVILDTIVLGYII